jgi:hypothetical protein
LPEERIRRGWFGRNTPSTGPTTLALLIVKGLCHEKRKVLVADKNLWRYLQNIFDTAFKNGCTIRLAKYLLMEKPLDTAIKSCFIAVKYCLLSSVYIFVVP